MHVLTEAERVWNRACDGNAISDLPGDLALAAMVGFHGVMMNGGVLHALQLTQSDGLEEVQDGYRYFGLDGVADLLEEAKSMATTDDELDLWGDKFQQYYDAVVPDDAALMAPFERIFDLRPSDFAPV